MTLTDAIANRTAKVVVIGQGYVGLSVAVGAAIAGMRVTGVDCDADRVAALARGELAVPGVDAERYELAIASGNLDFGTDPAVAASAKVVLVCVPTPLFEHRPDLSFVEAAVHSVAPHLRPETLVILESTTYPGTTEQVVIPRLEAGSGLEVGRDLLVAYSPERIDPGNPKFGLDNTPRVVGGVCPAATRAAATFYSHLVDQVRTVSSTRAAEMAKLLENTFRMVNIALVNELSMLCHEQGIETWEVIEAAATKPFGFMPFYPGPGVGGHCIPVDPAYLAWQSRRDAGRPYRLIELAQDVNREMPAYVATRIAEALNDQGKPIRGSRILALGVTYKPDVGDIRESAAIAVLRLLHRKGADLGFHDPFVERLREGSLALDRIPLDDAALRGIDCVALLTDHSVYDLERIAAAVPLLFDARGAARRVAAGTVVTL